MYDRPRIGSRPKGAAMRMRIRAALILGLAGLAATGAWAQTEEAPPRPFLRKVIGLDDAKLAAIEKGEVVTKQLTTQDKAEIAAFGVVKTSGTPDVLIRLAKDVQH